MIRIIKLIISLALRRHNLLPGRNAFGSQARMLYFEGNGGPPETRTPDPLIKSQLLYQLS